MNHKDKDNGEVPGGSNNAKKKKMKKMKKWKWKKLQDKKDDA